MGGLGNQLQQYALYKKLESMGRDARLDISLFRNASLQADMYAERELELDYLEELDYRAASEEEIRSVLGRLWEEPESIMGKIKRKLSPSSYPVFVESDMYYEQVLSFSNKYLVGYWACEKYYADILELLRHEIRFPKSENHAIQQKNDEIIRQMENDTSVSIHIRRGDYLDDMNKALFGNICKDTYYASAIAYMKEKLGNVKFYLFSDDIPYVQEHYQGEEYQVVDWNKGKDSFYDMMLMSHCKHNICANSTFSFWGARLNAHEDKVMIRPTIHKNSQVFKKKEMEALWAGWSFVSPDGKIQ